MGAHDKGNNFEIPIVLIIFNRPDETKQVLNGISLIRPKKLFVISDGPRINNTNDKDLISSCRSYIDQIDWDCKIIKIYSDINLGCMRNIILGLNKVFQITDKAIILEDDCKPTMDFFKFMEWGLDKFQHKKQVGMISGSNLIADKYKIQHRNGFSIFISIWGWATWKDRWEMHNAFLSLREINRNCNSLLLQKGFNYWQRSYWKNLFKFTVYCGSTWDFQLQYSFFKNDQLSVYPRINLIENIGFSGKGTHTNIGYPEYVKNNMPNNESLIMNYEENNNLLSSLYRDFLLARTIWNFKPFNAVKLKIKNFLIALNFLD